MVLTGAGVSTNAGVRDVHSPLNTVVPAGPGTRELRAQQAEQRALFARGMRLSYRRTPCSLYG